MSHTGHFAPRLLHLESSRARYNPDTTKNSSATFGLSRPITVPADYGLYVSCISAQIPYSFWGIPTAVGIPITYGASNTARTLTIPAGNYSAVQIASALTDTGVSGLTVTYDFALGTFKFTTNGTNQVTFPAQAVNLQIGIPASGQSIAISSSYQAPYAPQLLGPKAIQLNTSIPIQTTTAGCGTGQTLCFIPIDVSNNNLIVYKPGTGIPIKQYCESNYIDSITVSLNDEYGNPLDFKGLNWAIDICFELFTPPDMQGVSFTEQVEGGDLYSAIRRNPAQTRAYAAL